MFYTYSDNYGKNWIETDETNPVKVIENFYKRNCYVYDADVCGDEIVEFAFEIDGEVVYYELYYDWYMTYEEDGWEIHNNFNIEKINNSKTKFPGNRDWLVI